MQRARAAHSSAADIAEPNADWKPLVPQVPLVDHTSSNYGAAKYEEAYEKTIHGIKQLISERYPEVNFMDDTHKAGYQVINCKNISVMLDASQVLDDIQAIFDVHCKINLNMLPKNGPVIEILVPRRLRYGFSEKYSAWQRAQWVLGSVMIIGAVYAMYAMLTMLQ
jgi:hypothetical protein